MRKFILLALLALTALPVWAQTVVVGAGASNGASAVATNGIVVCTGTNCSTGTARTITGTANQITVTNGDGVSGNPTIGVPAGAITLSRPGGITTVVAGWPGATHYLHEDFVPAGVVCDTSGRLCGSTFLFGLTGTGATMAGGVNELNHPGTRIVRSGSTATNQAELQTTAAAGSMLWDNNFDAVFVVKPENSDGSTKMRFGVTRDAGQDPPTDGVYPEKLLADTNWFFVCRSASTETRTDTGIAHAVDWFTFRVRRASATEIAWSACSGEGCTLPAETVTSTNCPTGSVSVTDEARVTFFVETNTTATRGLTIDYADWLITGIVR